MKSRVIVGIILGFLGLIFILWPHLFTDLMKKYYKNSPIVKDEKQLIARSKFIIIFGIMWVLAGIFVAFFGP